MNIKHRWISRAVAGIALVILNASGALAAPVVIQKGSIAGYVYIPGTSVVTSGGSGSGTSSTLQNCYFSPLTDVTVSFGSLPSDMFPITVDYKMIGGGGGFSQWHSSYKSGGGGGGGGSSAIVKDGVLVAAAAGGKGADQGAGAGSNGAISQGSFTITQASSVRMVVGGGGGSIGWGEGIYYYNGGGTTNYYVHGAGGGAGYFGGGGGGSGYGNTPANMQGKGGGGGSTTGGAGGATATSQDSVCMSWSCYGTLGSNGAANNGGDGGNASSPVQGRGAIGLIGGANQAAFYYNSSANWYYASAGNGGGFGSGGGVGFSQTSSSYPSSHAGNNFGGSNGSAAPFLNTIGSTVLPSNTYQGWSSWGTNDYSKGGISSLALNQNAGNGGDFTKRMGATAGQVLLRYSAASCNLF